MVLVCEECGCVSGTGSGWRRYIGHDPDEPDADELALYCPPCAEQQFAAVSRDRYT